MDIQNKQQMEEIIKEIEKEEEFKENLKKKYAYNLWLMNKTNENLTLILIKQNNNEKRFK